LTTSCGGEGGLLNPQFQPQITNATDNFQFQTTAVTNVTQTLNYTWQNTGTRATINQACAITQGSATVTIRDAAGAQVYQSSLAANGTFQSSAGQAGAWTIIVSVNNVSGTLNFRVQKL
jgi:hypothetical protein